MPKRKATKRARRHAPEPRVSRKRGRKVRTDEVESDGPAKDDPSPGSSDQMTHDTLIARIRDGVRRKWNLELPPDYGHERKRRK